MLLAGCTSSKKNGPTPNGGNPKPGYSLNLIPTGPFHVTMIVEAPGVDTLTIGYTIGVGRSGYHPDTKEKVPWHLDTVVGPTSTLLLDLVADAFDQPNPGKIGISCTILVDGKVVRQNLNFRAAVCHYAQ
jgi:hypothetical protein